MSFDVILVFFHGVQVFEHTSSLMTRVCELSMHCSGETLLPSQQVPEPQPLNITCCTLADRGNTFFTLNQPHALNVRQTI